MNIIDVFVKKKIDQNLEAPCDHSHKQEWMEYADELCADHYCHTCVKHFVSKEDNRSSAVPSMKYVGDQDLKRPHR